MVLQLIRKYHKQGTNGTLYINNKPICFTIELPWNNNKINTSCIPQGNYKLAKRYSKKHGNHLWVKNVPNRSLILIHPANHALQELKGCIAPVQQLTGEGKGINSRDACKQIFPLVFEALENGEEVQLIVEKASEISS